MSNMRFGKKEEPREVVDKSTSSTINLIGQGTEISGDVSCKGDIRVDGKVGGNVSSKAKLVLGQNSEVKGSVSAQNAEISGIVEGNITVDELLYLRGSSVIKGDISVKRLVVEDGAVYEGRCVVGKDSSQKDSFNKPSSNGASLEFKKAEKTTA